MKGWAEKEVHNGELKLLVHACVGYPGTVLATPMWNRIWDALTSLEKDFIVMQWEGVVHSYRIFFTQNLNLVLLSQQ